MGSSGEEPNKAIDPTIGGLVWVRRRNGSWWPGKILSPEELPDGCVPTPRFGTPVKLLGREDASVEYDDCIKKVKESASHLSKKGSKYARREDAILHALELERVRLGVDHPELSSIRITGDDEAPSASHSSEESENLDENLNSSGDDLDSISESGEESKLSRTPNESEDDELGVKRMRGLEDLGMGSSLIKKKRSQAANVHELMKRKNRHRPLRKVMASTMMVPVTVESDMRNSGLESDESKRNDSVVINNNSDSNGVSCENRNLLRDNEIPSGTGGLENGSLQKLFDVRLVAEEQHSADLSSIISDASQPAHVVDAHSSPSSRVEVVALANEERNGSSLKSSDATNIHDTSQGIEHGASEWRFKGKRNSRLRKVDNEAETDETGVDRESSLSGFGLSADSKNPGKLRQTGWSWSSLEPHVPQRLLPYRQSRFTINPKYDDSDFSLRHHDAVSSLFEVNIEVKTSRSRTHHVPYISLMSKFTGCPIIGHPLTIEIVEDSLISGDGTVSNSKLEHKRSAQGRPPSSSCSRSSSRSRKNALLSKKTRKLSSLSAGSQRPGREVMKPVVEKLKGPSIACVPLKIVFSRINVALTGSVRNVTSIV